MKSYCFRYYFLPNYIVNLFPCPSMFFKNTFKGCITYMLN